MKTLALLLSLSLTSLTAEEPKAKATPTPAPAKAAANPESLRGRVVQVLKDGMMVSCGAGFYLNNADQIDGFDLPEVGGQVFLRGHPQQAQLVDGATIGVIAKRDATPFRDGAATLASFSFVSQASNASHTTRTVTRGAAAASERGGDVVISRTGRGEATARQLPRGVSRLQSVGGNVGK